jgi:electron transfer flavoprotein beta subunit
MLTIVVCVKQVVDPEAPLSLFEIAADGRNLVPPPGTPPVLSTFDENALEAALLIKDAVGARVVVLSLGNKLAKTVLKKTLAAGADDLILLDDERFGDLDGRGTALVLAKAIQKIGDVDLVLCGRQAADTDAGQVGVGLAAIMGIPAITLARQVEVNDGTLLVERLTADGYEVIEGALPALITASNEIGELRFPPVKNIIAAQKREVTLWDAAELDLDPTGTARTELRKYFVPDRHVECQIIEGGSPDEIAGGVAEVLRTRVV